jgi:hypothetical protein
MLVASRPWVFVLLVTAALGTAAWAAPSSHTSQDSHKGIAYRWVDEQGVVHYGDNIPPQYASQDRAILNAQGEEAAASRARDALMKQKQHDAFLVSTYTSVKDIEALRDVRLDQLKGQRTAAEQYLESLRVRLSSLQSRALAYRPYSTRADARRMPDDVAENLVHTLNEVRVQSSALAAKGAEETALRAQFQSDIERYRELHAIHSQSAAIPTVPRAAAAAE